jgi:hypothetical protein
MVELSEIETAGTIRMPIAAALPAPVPHPIGLPPTPNATAAAHP